MPAFLTLGSIGVEVAKVQVQLNAKGANPKLKVDGSFGGKTRAAVIAFQKQSHLSPDGIVGPLTQAALAQNLNIRAATHPLKFIPQPTDTTCWAAGTAMMTNSSVAAVIAKTPADMILPDGSLDNSSGSDQAIVTGTRYGNIHGLRCYPPMSWGTSAFVAALIRSPLMFDMLWNAAEYAKGAGSPGHMTVANAVVSAGAPAGDDTYLLILDPLPPKIGKISWVDYQSWIQSVPTRTYRVFERL